MEVRYSHHKPPPYYKQGGSPPEHHIITLFTIFNFSIMEKNLTVEEFKEKFHTSKLCFAIFRKTNQETGEVEIQYCHDAEGKVANYTDEASGEVKPLPRIVVRDTAKNIVAFCSAAVCATKMNGGKALEGAYFEPRVQADGSLGYQLRKSGSNSQYDLGEE